MIDCPFTRLFNRHVATTYEKLPLALESVVNRRDKALLW